MACSAASQQGFGAPGGSGGGDDSGDPTGSGSSGAGSPNGESTGDQSVVGSDAGIGDAYVAPVHFSDAAANHNYETSVPDAELAQSVTLTVAPFVVAAGDEVYMCQQFSNPFGQDVDIIEVDGQMSEGSHHFFVFNMDPTTGRNTAAPFGPCLGAGLEFHPYIYLSQQPNWDVTYPEADMGYPLVSQNGLMMNVHFLNATSEDMMAQATVTIHTAKPGVVTKPVGNLFLNNQAMSVAANTPESNPVWISSSTTPISTFDYQILQSWSHMHQYGLDFQAILGGPGTAPFYNETQWNEPPVTNHNPYIQVASGTPITWQCQYYNPTTSAMTFGDSALVNVMCIYFGMYYPAVPPSTLGYPDIVSAVN
jgi:hypothetical protein